MKENEYNGHNHSDDINSSKNTVLNGLQASELIGPIYGSDGPLSDAELAALVFSLEDINDYLIRTKHKQIKNPNYIDRWDKYLSDE